MQPIQQAFEPVSICFASDDNYAPYLKVAIYSLLCNRNRERSYDIEAQNEDAGNLAKM